MTTVSSTLKMFDAMTRPLQNITQGMNLMLSAMYQMQDATERNVNIDKTLTAAKHKLASAESELKSAIQQSTEAQNKFNQAAQSGAPEINQMNAAEARLIQTIERSQIALDIFNRSVQQNSSFISEAVPAERKIIQAIDQSTAAQDHFNQAAHGGTPEINKMMAAETEFIQAIERSQKALDVFNRSVQQSSSHITEMAPAERKIMQAIDQSTAAQDHFNNSMKAGHQHATSLLGRIKEVAAGMILAQAVMIGMQSVENGINASDDFILTRARLGLVNDGSQSPTELQDKIFEAANRSRGNYGDMASSVSKLGLLAGDAFSGNNEVVQFTELMNKAFKVGGSSITEQQAGMYQLTQAMAAGRLQGDEFRSIMENAPMLAAAIADFTGKSKGELREMSAEGTITADVIKGALFNAADDINAKFKTIPMTFSDVATKLRNRAIQAFEPVIENLNRMLNSADGSQLINNSIVAINALAQATNAAVSGMIWIGSAVSNNWGMIEPAIWAVIGALMIYNTKSLISMANTAKDIFLKGYWAAATVYGAMATIGLTIAQNGLNKAIALCPITWIIGAIILLISIFYFAVAAVNHFAGTSISATGLITGAFLTLAAILVNTLGAAFNFILSTIDNVLNVIAMLGEFLANVFIDPVGSIVRLFAGLADTVLSIVQSVVSAIDTLTGGFFNLADGIDSWRTSLQGAVDDLVGEPTIKLPRLDSSWLQFKPIDYEDAFNAGYKWGDDLSKKFDLANMFKMPGDLAMPPDLGNIPNIDYIGTVGKIKDKVDISSEDIKIMRELAEMKNIQNFVTLTPTVSVSTGDIHNGQSVDTIVAKIKNMLETEIASSTSAVYGQ